VDLGWLPTASGVGTGSVVVVLLLVFLRSMHSDRDHYRREIEATELRASKAIAAAEKRATEAEARTREVRADKDKLRKRADSEMEQLHQRFNAERDDHHAAVDRLYEQLRQVSAELADTRRLLARCCVEQDRDGPP